LDALVAQGEQGAQRDRDNAYQVANRHGPAFVVGVTTAEDGVGGLTDVDVGSFALSLAIPRRHVADASTNGSPGWPESYGAC
jgi:hypothetical protein